MLLLAAVLITYMVEDDRDSAIANKGRSTPDTCGGAPWLKDLCQDAGHDRSECPNYQIQVSHASIFMTFTYWPVFLANTVNNTGGQTDMPQIEVLSGVSSLATMCYLFCHIFSFYAASNRLTPITNPQCVSCGASSNETCWGGSILTIMILL